MENEKQAFLAYEAVRKSGVTNMFDVSRVQTLMLTMCPDVYRADIAYIMQHYSELKAKYLDHEK
jgi:hypothetical protein